MNMIKTIYWMSIAVSVLMVITFEAGILEPGCGAGDVVRPRETEVVVTCHEVDLRKSARNDVYGVIFRVIVNDIHLGVYVLQRAPQAAEALLKVMPDVITYYYNR